MNQSGIKENIACLLEEIMQRSLQISKSTPADSLLEIDLVMEDMRLLYREYASLRQIAESEAFLASREAKKVHKGSARPMSSANGSKQEESPSELPREIPEEQPREVPSEPLPDDLPPVSPPQETPPEPSHVPGVPPEVPENNTHEESQVEQKAAPEPEVSMQQPTPDSKVEKPVEPARVSPPDEPADKPTQDATSGDDQQPREQEPQKPVMPDTPVTPKTEPSARPVGRKAIIDLFSEPAEKAIGDHHRAKDDNSLHQRISRTKTDSSIGARMQQTPISGIRDAIGVNDKFLFINELFQGNIQAYNDAVSSLNAADNLKAAFDMLNQMAEDYSWDEKRSGDTIEKLASFVQRRHM